MGIAVFLLLKVVVPEVQAGKSSPVPPMTRPVPPRAAQVRHDPPSPATTRLAPPIRPDEFMLHTSWKTDFNNNSIECLIYGYLKFELSTEFTSEQHNV